MIAGLILAGGRARRMGGGEKCLLPLHGKPLAEHVAERMTPQVGRLVVSANGELGAYAAFGTVLTDAVAGDCGPLGGVLTAMEWAGRETGVRWLASCPGDAPFFPDDFVARALAAVGNAWAAVAVCGEWTHPLHALWRVDLAPALRAYLAEGGRRVEGFTERCGAAIVRYPASAAGAFLNVNAPDDLLRARAVGDASAAEQSAA